MKDDANKKSVILPSCDIVMAHGRKPELKSSMFGAIFTLMLSLES
jgi:hypothetical protein